MTRTSAAYGRRHASDGAGVVEWSPLVAIDLERVTAAWSGGAGTVRLEVDGTVITSSTGTPPLALRLDRLERVNAGQTITLTMPAAGTAHLAGRVHR